MGNFLRSFGGLAPGGLSSSHPRNALTGHDIGKSGHSPSASARSARGLRIILLLRHAPKGPFPALFGPLAATHNTILAGVASPGGRLREAPFPATRPCFRHLHATDKATGMVVPLAECVVSWRGSRRRGDGRDPDAKGPRSHICKIETRRPGIPRRGPSPGHAFLLGPAFEAAGSPRATIVVTSGVREPAGPCPSAGESSLPRRTERFGLSFPPAGRKQAVGEGAAPEYMHIQHLQLLHYAPEGRPLAPWQDPRW